MSDTRPYIYAASVLVLGLGLLGAGALVLDARNGPRPVLSVPAEAASAASHSDEHAQPGHDCSASHGGVKNGADLSHSECAMRVPSPPASADVPRCPYSGATPKE